AMCNLQLMINNISCGILKEDFRQSTPQAEVVTGQCYGSVQNVYIEYMANSTVMLLDGSSHWYLDHETFRREGHGQIIRRLFDENLLTTSTSKPYPIPRPTRACTPDWVVNLQGMCMLTGEGKASGPPGSDSKAGIHDVILLACKQLSYSPLALAMHSNNRRFRFMQINKNDQSETLQVYIREGTMYELTNPTSLSQPSRHHVRDDAFPPLGIYISSDQKHTNLDTPSEGMIVDWNRLDVRLRSLAFAILEGMDILGVQFVVSSGTSAGEAMDTYDSIYEQGTQGPTYWQVRDEEMHAMRQVADPGAFVYCEETMSKLASGVRPSAAKLAAAYRTVLECEKDAPPEFLQAVDGFKIKSERESECTYPDDMVE
ncbi:MAG: hypothetical protein V3T88_05555, partial [Nitrosomonadaceae bacterium]